MDCMFSPAHALGGVRDVASFITTDSQTQNNRYRNVIQWPASPGVWPLAVVIGLLTK